MNLSILWSVLSHSGNSGATLLLLFALLLSPEGKYLALYLPSTQIFSPACQPTLSAVWHWAEYNGLRCQKKNIDWWNWTRSLKLWDLNRLAERLQSCIILCGFVTLCKLFWLNFTAICSKYHEATGVRHAWCITESIHSFMLSAVQWSLIRLTLLSEILCSFSWQRLPCEWRIVSCALFLSRREKRGDGRVRSCWKVRGQGWVYRWESSCAQGLTGSVGCTVPPITHAAWGLCHLCN